MDAVFRAVIIYVFLLLVFRIAGERTLASLTTFDFVLLLIIAEATQQGLIGDDFSVVKALLLVATLVALDIGLSLLKERWTGLNKALEGVPLVIVEDARVLDDRMRRARIDVEDVLQAATRAAGVGKHGPDQIRRARAHRRNLDRAAAVIVKRRPAIVDSRFRNFGLSNGGYFPLGNSAAPRAAAPHRFRTRARPPW